MKVELSEGEIRYLIDCMWAHSRHESQAYAFRHGINDVAVESHLQQALSTLIHSTELNNGHSD